AVPAEGAPPGAPPGVSPAPPRPPPRPPPAPPRPPPPAGAPGTWKLQISFPVSGCRATTRLPAPTYITPFTTIGVDWPPMPWNVHAGVNFETFVVSICVNVEYRVPARSPMYQDQSAPGFLR